eukprot:SAG22_NODE_60_length_23423_cov_8.445250_8_plen_378_part_00
MSSGPAGEPQATDTCSRGMQRLRRLGGHLAERGRDPAVASTAATTAAGAAPGHLVLASMGDFLGGAPAISHGAAGPIVGGNPWPNRAVPPDESSPFAPGSPWVFVYCGVMPPGAGVGLHTHSECEEMFITLDNRCEFTHNNRTTEVAGPCAVPVRCGESHGLFNPSPTSSTFFLDFNVSRNIDPVRKGQLGEATDLGDTLAGRSDQLVSAEQLPVGRLDRALLRTPAARAAVEDAAGAGGGATAAAGRQGGVLGGQGPVLSREVWGARDFTTSFTHLSHFVLPPGTSLGKFTRATTEEVWFVIAGSGLAAVGDGTPDFQISTRQFVFVAAGQEQGFRNPSGAEAPLELLAVGASILAPPFDAADPKPERVTFGRVME